MTSREEALKVLGEELGYLKKGLSHPDTTTALFTLFIVRLQDSTLLELAPSDIRGRIDGILDDFERDGYRHAHSAKGGFLDLTMETKSLLKIVRGKERAAVVHLGPYCDCGFCSKQESSTDSPVIPRGKILQEPHEGATFGFCVKCDRPYLMYWVEARDEMFRYHCPLSDDEYGRLREAVTVGQVGREDISALIWKSEVFFISPWDSKWVNGGRVLVEPRPW